LPNLDFDKIEELEPDSGVFVQPEKKEKPQSNYHTLKSGMIDCSEGKIEFKIEEEI
jgi:hypothetical protein